MPEVVILDRTELETEDEYQETISKYIHPTTDEEKRKNNMITADDMPA